MGIISNDSGMLILSDAGKPLSLLCCVVCIMLLFLLLESRTHQSRSHTDRAYCLLYLHWNTMVFGYNYIIRSRT